MKDKLLHEVIFLFMHLLPLFCWLCSISAVHFYSNKLQEKKHAYIDQKLCHYVLMMSATFSSLSALSRPVRERSKTGLRQVSVAH